MNFKSLKHLSIGIGLAISFGNVITASPSYADVICTSDGKICSTSPSRIPGLQSATTVTRESSLQPKFSCKDISGFTRNCTPQSELPRDIINPQRGLPKR
jgi:hypothetical protein